MPLKNLKLARLSAPLTDIKFDCGDTDLNDFFLQDAFHHQQQLLAVTYILWDQNKNEIIAYFSVLNDGIEANNRLNRSIPNEKRHRKIPAVKIGRFAVNKNYQKTGIGSKILDFIKYWFVHKNKTGCRFLLADAYNKPETTKFYIKNGFSFLTATDEKEETRAMKFDLKPYALQMKDLRII